MRKRFDEDIVPLNDDAAAAGLTPIRRPKATAERLVGGGDALMTIDDIAKRVGVSTSGASGVVNGTRRPFSKTVGSVPSACDEFGRNANDIALSYYAAAR
ncbi:MAG: hypothetical protein ABSF67_22790 [Roseiarcus sp.]